MKIRNFVLCCTFFTSAVAFTLPDIFEQYRSGYLPGTAESSACECKNGRCVTDNRGKTKCICPPEFALQGDNVCEKCDCGSRGKCMFIPLARSAGSVTYEKKCLCDVGSAEKDGLCIDCHCGENSKCEFEDDEKICYCIENYAEKDGVCTECNCGFFGQCSFRNGVKNCECDENYLENDGVCKEDLCITNCGVPKGETVDGVTCVGDGITTAECGCSIQGYIFVDKNIQCREDLCITKCGVPKGEIVDGVICEGDGITTAECGCSTRGYAFVDKNMKCRECDCGEQSQGCEFEGEKKVCYCPEGYVQKGDVCSVKCGLHRTCQNGGYCDGGICICRPGTKGEFCEIINDCDHLCPKYTNINCSYDVEEEKAYCKCLVPGMDYYPEVKDCRTTCSSDSDCINGGVCTPAGRSKFCSCLEGTAGDMCEKVLGCVEMECGELAKCVYDVKERRAACKCVIEMLTFDPFEYKCKVKVEHCDEELMHCRATGGLCNLDSDNKIHCECPEHSEYDFNRGCKVKDGYCDEMLPFCQDTSGLCISDRNEKVRCQCPDYSKYEFDRGCIVEDYHCDERMPNCRNTRGLCILAKDENIRCECPTNSIYDVDKGCIVPDDGCATFKPKCLETRGTCVLNDKLDVSCICPEGFAYEESKGCKGICRSSSDCLHGGICIEGVNKFCECLEGTEGDLCENVPGCDSMDCGYDAKCEYSIWRRAAVCQCYDDRFAFDLETKKCKRTCAHLSDCLNGGTCVESKSSGSKFCECPEGTEGDLCEKIPDCDRMDCGSDARCVFDVKEGKAVCACKDKALSFDEVDDKCKRSCYIADGGCLNGGECVSRDSHNHLCKCPEGTSGDLCQVVDECVSGSGKCKGNDSLCVYDTKLRKAVCLCKNEGKRYDPLSEGCKTNCTTNSQCKNGGLCMNRGSDDRFCVCKPGISGDLCENVDLCRVKCGNGDDLICKYDVHAEKASCLCKDAKSVFDPSTKSCKPCDCGGKEISCEVEDGKVICVCPEGFAEVDGKCKKQRCTEKKCSNGKCEVISDEEVCTCYEGYKLDGDECIKLNCVKTPCLNGTCVVRQGGLEQCVCPAGYTLRGDVCIRGVCRMNTCFGGRCQIVAGELTCVCPERFHVEGVGCFETVCKIQRCFGGKCVVENYKEICTCPDGYFLENDVCKKILCEKKNCFGGKCHITDGVEECTCPDGYTIFEDVCRRNI